MNIDGDKRVLKFWRENYICCNYHFKICLPPSTHCCSLIIWFKNWRPQHQSIYKSNQNHTLIVPFWSQIIFQTYFFGETEWFIILITKIWKINQTKNLVIFSLFHLPQPFKNTCRLTNFWTKISILPHSVIALACVIKVADEIFKKGSSTVPYLDQAPRKDLD